MMSMEMRNNETGRPSNGRPIKHTGSGRRERGPGQRSSEQHSPDEQRSRRQCSCGQYSPGRRSPGRRSNPRRRRTSVFSIAIILLSLLSLCLFAACGSPGEIPPSEENMVATEALANRMGENLPWTAVLAGKLAEQEPPLPGAAGPGLTWYQVFVYSFCDSDGDGIGDLNGVTQSLDYIQSMGFDGIWLSPIHPSSTYHKYNVSDYIAIDPEYGTMEDFDAFIEACNARGIRVILDLVINHSDLHHLWFTERPEFYNIADEPGNGNWERLPDGRWYECQFWGEMPDLNLDNEELRAELEQIFAFWLERGVSGFRLDAIKDYYSGNIEVI